MKTMSTVSQKSQVYKAFIQKLNFDEEIVKILCLSTYPVEEPMHGGQHRLRNIIDLLAEVGHEVYSVGVLGSPTYPSSPYFLEYPGRETLSSMVEYLDLMEDFAISELFSKNDTFFKRLANLIPKTPDVIYCEQPWLFSFAKKYAQKFSHTPPSLIYGSANIEHNLKYGIINSYFGEDRAIYCSEMVRNCEVYASKNADLVFSVSKSDIIWLSEFSKREPILAPNGVIDRIAGMTDIMAANTITQGRQFALYCASAHPPNMDGFFEMFGYGVGCFPPNSLMVVAGGAGQNILHDPKFAHVGGMHKVYADAGRVSESVLRGLLATAHQIVLPITYGGGTNLKAAEAIWAGCHVVATTKAMQGFEEFSNVRGMVISDSPEGFCAAIRENFLRPRMHLSTEERDARRGVLWEKALASLVGSIGGGGSRYD
ncbi:glycosyltransferase [Novosphingobium sp. NBM11]|uniref:glycosyltransferase n=1 Tax=Novosphingobium sp. NBM11 TaxID=2596914 RepID=UPI0018922D62|nr:glycosyltransferase [Novosphingobium sp. NBM11]